MKGLVSTNHWQMKTYCKIQSQSQQIARLIIAIGCWGFVASIVPKSALYRCLIKCYYCHERKALCTWPGNNVGSMQQQQQFRERRIYLIAHFCWRAQTEIEMLCNLQLHCVPHAALRQNGREINFDSSTVGPVVASVARIVEIPLTYRENQCKNSQIVYRWKRVSH